MSRSCQMFTEKWTRCPFRMGLMPRGQSTNLQTTQEQDMLLGQWAWSSFSRRQEEKVNLPELTLTLIPQCYQPTTTWPGRKHFPVYSPGTSISILLSFQDTPSRRKSYVVSNQQAIISSRSFFPFSRKWSKAVLSFSQNFHLIVTVVSSFRGLWLAGRVIDFMDWSDWAGYHCICVIQQFPRGSDWSTMVSKILIKKITIWGWSISSEKKVYLREENRAELTDWSC